jgi:hypothetical protein
LPRRGVLGNPVSGILISRKPRGHKKSRGY